MNPTSSRRAGLLLFGLLSLGDTAALPLTDGKSPPYAVATIATVLGLVSLVLVVRAVREPARPMRLLIALRVLSAASALPAFLVPDVPLVAQGIAAVVVVLTAAGVVLTSHVGRELATS